MSVRSRLSLAGAVAVLLSTGALWPVFATLTWLPRAVGAVLVVLGASAAARRLQLPRVLHPALGLAALLGYLALVFAGGTLALGLLPTGATVSAFRELLEQAGTDLSQYGPPAPATLPLVLLVVGGVGLVAVVVDTLAGLLAQPAAAGLPLLALFAVPSAVVPGGLGWFPFVLGAAGWLGLLLVEGREQAVRWGTPLRTTAGGDLAGLGRVGRRIGGAALGVAVLVPVLIPGLDGRLLDGGEGGGSGAGGSRSVTTYNPITRLRGELTLPEPIEVLRYTTDDPDPDYLRMTTLSVYDGAGWRQEVLRGNLREDGVDDPIPTPVGRSGSVTSRTVSAQVDISTLQAFWLPVPATPNRVEIEGPWMWDPGSQSIFSTRSDTAEVDGYTVRSARVLPDQEQLNASDDVLPEEIEPYVTSLEATDAVRELTERVVAGERTAYERASAIQAFFRDEDNGFRYDEDTGTGGSPDALEDFLTVRRGFCEQYASAMGAMLRLAGVPSRVAVGFTSGVRQSDGSYLVTTDQAHAWPEAWFEGAGWVRFEPTPSQGGIRPPVYAAPTPTAATPGSTTPTTAPDPGAAADGGETPAERLDRLEQEAAGGPAEALDDRSSLEQLPVRLLGAGLAVVLLLATPSVLHTVRRRRRWRTPSAGAAWAQLREDATDTGYPWQAALTPRAAAARLVTYTAMPAPAAAAVARLTEAVEHERYARPAAPVPTGGSGGGTALAERPVRSAVSPGLAGDSATVRQALRARLSRSRRLRTALFPASTLRRTSSWLGERTADLLDAGDNALGTVGAFIRRRRR